MTWLGTRALTGLIAVVGLVAAGCTSAGSNASVNTGGGETFGQAQAAPTTAPTVAAAPTPVPNLWAHSTGAFEAAMPEGWAVASSFRRGDPAQPTLVALPTLHPTGSDGPSFTIGKFADEQSPAAFLDGLPASTTCPTNQPRTSRTVGATTVEVSVSGGCPNGLVQHLVAFTDSSGVVVAISARVTDADLRFVDSAVESYGPGTTAATLSELYPCIGFTTDPTGTTVRLVNYSGGPATIDGDPVDPGRQGSVVVAPGTQVTIGTSAGEAVHTATSDPMNCVIAKPDSLDHIRPPG